MFNLTAITDALPKMQEFSEKIIAIATEMRDNQLVILGNQQQIESKLDILLGYPSSHGGCPAIPQITEKENDR